jgi:hypothetical protein
MMTKSKKIALIGIIFIIAFSILWASVVYNKSQSISTVKIQKNNLENKLLSVDKNLDITNDLISNCNAKVDELKGRLQQNISDLNYLKFGKRYELHDPLAWEVTTFMYTDPTNRKRYDEETFNCGNYAAEVNNNAEKKGLRCAFVVVNLTKGAHALVAFYTRNMGIIYYEPQTDEKVNLQVGKDYWASCVVPSGYYYYLPDPDNVVEDFVLYW